LFGCLHCMEGVFIHCTKYYWPTFVYNEAVLKDDCMVRVVLIAALGGHYENWS